jgi:hypothetical protein
MAHRVALKTVKAFKRFIDFWAITTTPGDLIYLCPFPGCLRQRLSASLALAICSLLSNSNWVSVSCNWAKAPFSGLPHLRLQYLRASVRR